MLKRRQAIESILGQHKADPEYQLKVSEGDAFHAVLCVAGINIRWLLRMFVKKGLDLLLCLLQASGLTGLIAKLAEILGLNRLQNSEHHWSLA